MDILVIIYQILLLTSFQQFRLIMLIKRINVHQQLLITRFHYGDHTLVFLTFLHIFTNNTWQNPLKWNGNLTKEGIIK